MPGHRISEQHPWRSHSCGCHPAQAKEFNEILRQHGITSAHFDEKNGQAVATTNGGRNGVLKVTGMFDKDAGYGQYAGK